MKEFKSRLRKFLPRLKEAREKGMNEADTRMRIKLLFSEVLGYDLLDEITQEHMVQGHYVDISVKMKSWDKASKGYKNKIMFFIETKSADTTLRETHVYQATNYAATAGVNLCLLTNGADYKAYHLSWHESKIEKTEIMSFNVVDDPLNDVAGMLFLLSKQSFKKGEMDKYIAESTTLSDKNLAVAMLSERVINAIRLELRAITGHNVSADSISPSVRDLFSSDILEYVLTHARRAQKRKKSQPPLPKQVAEKLIEDSQHTSGQENDE